MSFLHIENGKPQPTPEGWHIPQVKAVYAADKTDGKGFFNDVIAYVFWMYKRDGVYADSFESYRRKMVIERHLPKRDAQELEENKRVKELIAEYLDRQMTKNERLLYQVEKDMDELLKHISGIPHKKTIIVKVPITNDQAETTYVPTKVEMDNSDEKFKAIKTAKEIVEYGDLLKTKILKDKTDLKKKGSSTRLFDRPK